MICLAPTKALVDVKQIDTIVPHPQQMLEPVQFLFDFIYKVFIPLFYEPLQLIHLDIHLQYFIKKHCLYVHLVEFPIHGHSYCENAYIDDELGHWGKGLVESHCGHLNKYIFY